MDQNQLTPRECAAKLEAIEKKIDDLRTKNEYNGVEITDNEEKKEIIADLKQKEKEWSARLDRAQFASTQKPTWQSPSFTLSAEPASYSVTIMNQKQGGALLLAIPCLSKGRRWDRVLLFLKAVCGDFDIQHYSLSSNNSDIELSDDLHLPPAEFTLSPIDDSHSVLTVIFQPLPIVPRSTLSRRTSGATTPIEEPSSSSRPQKKPRVESEVDKLVVESTKAFGRDATFEKRIFQRDQHCIITRQYRSLKASHIVAHAWWMDHPDRKERLPEDIKRIIRSLDGGIDHITNGIFLDGSISDAFDRGDFSFQFVDGHYYVVSITPDYDSIDGLQVDECVRNRWDGTVWWCPENRPNPYLMAFHLRNSVFAHCRGAAGYDEFDTEDDKENVKIARSVVSEFFENSEIGSKIASSLTSEALAQFEQTHKLSWKLTRMTSSTQSVSGESKAPLYDLHCHLMGCGRWDDFWQKELKEALHRAHTANFDKLRGLTDEQQKLYESTLLTAVKAVEESDDRDRDRDRISPVLKCDPKAISTQIQSEALQTAVKESPNDQFLFSSQLLVDNRVYSRFTQQGLGCYENLGVIIFAAVMGFSSLPVIIESVKALIDGFSRTPVITLSLWTIIVFGGIMSTKLVMYLLCQRLLSCKIKQNVIFFNERLWKFDIYREALLVQDIFDCLGMEGMKQFFESTDDACVFTPGFYPKCFFMKDALYFRDITVLQRLIEEVVEKYKKAGVVYVEFSVSVKDLYKYPWVFHQLCVKAKAEERAAQTHDKDGAVKEKSECKYRFLAAVARMERRFALNDEDAIAINSNTESVDGWLDRQCPNDPMSHYFDSMKGGDELLKMVRGLDWVSDEYGYPYCPFYREKFFEYSRRQIERNAEKGFPPCFGLRPHLGEVTEKGYEEWVDKNGRKVPGSIYFDVHKKIITKIAERMMQGQLVPYDLEGKSYYVGMRFGHGVALLVDSHFQKGMVVELNYTSNKRLLRFLGCHEFVEASKNSLVNELIANIVIGTDNDGIFPCITGDEQLIKAELLNLKKDGFVDTIPDRPDQQIVAQAYQCTFNYYDGWSPRFLLQAKTHTVLPLDTNADQLAPYPQ